MRKVLYIKKKTIITAIMCFLLVLLCPFIVFVVVPSLPTSMYEPPENGIIVIDPGHGGIDGGAAKNDVVEKYINLDTSLKLKALLIQRGYKVIMTREEDVSLEAYGNGSNRHRKDLDARVNIINNSNAQLFVSIHTNYSPKKASANGSIVFYNKRYYKNVLLAYDIQRALNNISAGGMTRTIHDPVAEKYYILDRAKIPGNLVEIGFLTNTRERELLKKDEFRESVAEAIMSGIDKYLGKNTLTHNIISKLVW